MNEDAPLEMIHTADGSVSLYHKNLDETYHSRHGAIAESNHVFIKQGLTHWCALNPNSSGVLSILEMGFGTGLNCLLTLLHRLPEFSIAYSALEAYPLPLSLCQSLGYAQQLNCDPEQFMMLHRQKWDKTCTIGSDFTLIKRLMRFEDFTDKDAFDLVYYDAFGARVQPEHWEKERFEALYQGMRQGGVLVTYAAKGSVRRAMQEVGFTVERLPGPPGKREMLRATKPH
ncbi:MAG: tRNA (5-methylaminomethyl-2-thiouridine)(34)-methyltransferase MnmD [Flavobacteriaceae bacterium]